MSESWRLQEKNTETRVSDLNSSPINKNRTISALARPEPNQNYSNVEESKTNQDLPEGKIYRSVLTLDRTSNTKIDRQFVPGSKTKRCSKCFLEIDQETQSEIEFSNRVYHSHCFNCGLCHKNLKNSTQKTYRVNSEGEPLCSDCELSTAKRCEICSRQIIGEKAILFDEKQYHRACFRCDFCYQSMADDKELTKSNSKLCCLRCANKNLGPSCAACFKSISPGKFVVFDTKKYHKECFRCGQCNQVMTDQNFYTRDGKPCCNKCYDERFAERCAECSKVISSGKTIVYDSKTFHPDCFRCGQCYRVMNEQKFHTRNEKPCCNQCFTTRFAETCAVCHKIIDGKSTIFAEKKYHVDCFRCGLCGQLMPSGTKCFTHGEKPCCDRCYSDRVAPRCTQCNRPINGNYTTHRDKPYHKECFVCARCKRIIGSSEKFYNEQGTFVCTGCAA